MLSFVLRPLKVYPISTAAEIFDSQKDSIVCSISVFE